MSLMTITYYRAYIVGNGRHEIRSSIEHEACARTRNALR